MDETTDTNTSGDTRTDPAPPPSGLPGGPDSGPRVSGGEMRDLGRLRRSSSDRYIAGVAGGLGRHFDIDPTVVRVLLVVLAFFGGAGVLLYVAAWLFVPEDTKERAPINLGPESRKVLLIAVAVLAAVSVLGVGFGGDGWSGLPFGVIVLAVVVIVVLSTRDRHEVTGGSTPPPPWQGAAEQPPMWAPPAASAYVPPPRPRRTGPVLFWPTLAMIAIALGLLGLYDVDADVLVSAYAALALAVTAVMLLVGAFVARPGGLIALGLVAAMGLGITSAIDSATQGDYAAADQVVIPESTQALPPEVFISTGNLVVDLRKVADPEALSGRVLSVRFNAGEVRVILPPDVAVEASARLRYVGALSIGGEQREGIEPSHTVLLGSDDSGTPRFVLRVEGRVGDITIEQEG